MIWKKPQDWHLWFAWHPVRCEVAIGLETWVWLEQVYRCHVRRVGWRYEVIE